MFATQVLPETCSEAKSKEERILESVGFIVVENKKHEVKKGENKMGRDPTICSIVLENFTVSKLHAIIESDGVDETFIYDVGSTNQTKLGKKSLKPYYRYKIDNGALITLGNVVTKFVVSSVIEDDSKSTEMFTPSGSGGHPPGSDILNELGDIFDIATQVDIPQPSSKATTEFERMPDNFQLFKAPSPLTQCKGKKVFPETSKTCSETSTWSKFNLKGSPKYFSEVEDPSIFSLTTQCQLPEHLPLREPDKESENERSGRDKLKSFLSDGEDDVFCSLMAIYSPDGHFQQNKPRIKTEVAETNLDGIFDFPTQMPFKCEPKESTASSKSQEMKQEVLVKESLEKDFDCVIKQEHSQIPSRAYSGNKPVVGKTAEGGGEGRSDQKKDGEKDSKSGEENLSQNSSDSFLEVTVADIEVENGEDLILTQKFDCLGKDIKSRVKQEDFGETQVRHVKSLKCRDVVESIPKIPSMVVRESSDDDTESDLEISLQSSTQRNKDEDFISTQPFGSGQSENKEGNARTAQSPRIAEPVEDGEDFIATQIKGEPQKQEMHIRGCRQSSPDLLSGCPQSQAEDFTCTQVFEIKESKPDVRTKALESISVRRLGVLEDDGECAPRVEVTSQNQVPPPPTSPSSGDETESDLEIILTHAEGKPPKEKSSPEVKKESREDEVLEGDRSEDSDSNSSYVFRLEQTQVETTKEVVHVTDSDATDCEEMDAVKMKTDLVACKKEAPEGGGQVPGNRATAKDDRLSEEDSPKFQIEEVDSVAEEPNHLLDRLSFKIFETQEEETEERPASSSKSRKSKVNVKSSSCVENKKAELTKSVDSPVKRIRSEDSFAEAVPTKKCRNAQNEGRSTERKFTRLWQTHDMSHIQATRTRSSTKNLELEKSGNSAGSTLISKWSPCRRKGSSGSSGKARNEKCEVARRNSEGKKSLRVSREKDGTASMEDFLIKSKSPEVKNVSRILRSGRRKSGSLGASNLFDSSLSSSIRSGSRRNCRTKNERSYFGSFCVSVVFTGFECEYLEKIISDLGGERSQDLSCGQVVVTDKVRRTVKFLCAVGLGLPVASPKWLLSCREANKFVNPWNYVLRDEESEEKWDFDLRRSLEKAKRTKLLRGFSVYATESTKPPVRELLAIVECCGGVPLFERPEVWPKKTIVVSCVDDKDSWPPPKFRHVKIVHYEFILSGALKQKIDFNTYNLR